MKRLWLIFAQTVTICLGILFLVATLRPQWLPGGAPTPGVLDGTPAA
ncbi:MAG: 2-alkenal reductase, partial [Castellaniella sp.]